MKSEMSVEEYARRQLDRLGKSAKQLRGGEPNAIHDARVASRRLDAALDVLLARGPREGRGAESKVLQRLRRRLGRLREREGITQSLRTLLETEDPKTRDAGERLLDRLARRVTRGRRRAVQRIQSRHREVLVLRAVSELRSLPDADALSRDAQRWADARRAQAERALAIARRTKRNQDLHQARLTVKKWRYALEVLAQATGEPPQKENERLIELQRCLGSIHDDDVLLVFLRRWSRRWRRRNHQARASALTPLLRRLSAARRLELRRLDEAFGPGRSLELSSTSPSGS